MKNYEHFYWVEKNELSIDGKCDLEEISDWASIRVDSFYDCA